MEAALAVTPMAMSKKIRAFSRIGRRSWCRKVRGYSDRTTSVTILTIVPVLDTRRNCCGVTHFAPVMDKFQAAANGRHCSKGKRNRTKAFAEEMAMVNWRKSCHALFCWKRKSEIATLSFIKYVETAHITAPRIPNLTTCCTVGTVAKECDESANHTMA